MAGEYGSERAITLLRKYSSDHPDDARGHLLLARLYLNRHWHADAIGQYSAAYRRVTTPTRSRVCGHCVRGLPVIDAWV